MYSVMKKNIENSDAPTRSPTMLAPVNVRDRKIRNGINGASDRSSIATNAAISAAESASSSQRLGRAPPCVGRVDERVDEHREAGGHADRARGVEVARRRLRAGLRDRHRRSAATASAIGTLIHRTHSHPSRR